jgi:hypothetical protein
VPPVNGRESRRIAGELSYVRLRSSARALVARRPLQHEAGVGVEAVVRIAIEVLGQRYEQRHGRPVTAIVEPSVAGKEVVL